VEPRRQGQVRQLRQRLDYSSGPSAAGFFSANTCFSRYLHSIVTPATPVKSSNFREMSSVHSSIEAKEHSLAP
ncbi:hypothetical protein DBR06_SOUSAS8410067, partial [Sousa chinensis]